MSAVDEALDRFFEARAAIFTHVGYVEDWRVLPIDDSRDQFWAVDTHEREWVKFSPKREAIAYWLAEHDDEYGPYGNECYENVIYTQRHLKKWVYRGAELTLVVVDTQTDGNKFLQIFRNENEVRPGDAAPSSPPDGDWKEETWGQPRWCRYAHDDEALNDAIDSMYDANWESPSSVLLEKVRVMCRAIEPLSDLLIAVDVHRANCDEQGCPVLAAMEETAKQRSTALRTCPGCGRTYAMLYICEGCGRCDERDLPRDADKAAPCCDDADACVERDWRSEEASS